MTTMSKCIVNNFKLTIFYKFFEFPQTQPNATSDESKLHVDVRARAEENESEEQAGKPQATWTKELIKRERARIVYYRLEDLAIVNKRLES